jgi:[ribosomal protein S18]-alanine N-acetyltransferase
MKLISVNMSRELALEILTWHYEHPYDFYNNSVSNEGLMELMTNGYNAVLNEKGDLFGFYCTGIAAQVPSGSSVGAYASEAVDVGIGMKPEFTGKGYGNMFFLFVLELLSNNYPSQKFRLTVASFNKRAIRLYENLGFNKQAEFMNGANAFITMVKM